MPLYLRFPVLSEPAEEMELVRDIDGLEPALYLRFSLRSELVEETELRDSDGIVRSQALFWVV